MTRAPLSLAIAAVLIAGSTGQAIPDPAPPRLAAVAGAVDDVRASVLVGPSGQVYAPDGRGAWVRHAEGGIAATVTTAVLIGGRSNSVIAGGVGSAPYRFADGTWTAIHLAHGAPVIGSGLRAVVAVGREIFAIDRGSPTHLADAPFAITAVASGVGVAVSTAQGSFRLDGTTLRKLDLPSTVALISDQWGMDARGAVLVRSGTRFAWPTGVTIVIAAPGADGALAAVGTSTIGLELVVVHAKGSIDRSVVPVANASAPVGVMADRDGRALVATAAGQVAIRDHGTWTVTTIRDDLPGAHPGAPPALSH